MNPRTMEIPGIPGSTRYICPISTCEWYHDELPPAVGPNTLAQVFGQGVFQAVSLAGRAAKIETLLATHVNRHTPVEWITEIRKAETDTKNRIIKAITSDDVSRRLLPEHLEHVVHVIEES